MPRKKTSSSTKHKIKPNGRLTLERYPSYFLLAAIVLLFYWLYIIYEPFVTALVFAAFIAVIFHPVYFRLKKLFKGMRKLSALVTCFIVILILVIPVSIFLSIFIQEGIDAFFAIANAAQSGILKDVFMWEDGGILYDLFQRYIPQLQFVDIASIDLNIIGKIGETAQNVGSLFIKYLFNFIENIFGFFFSLFIFFFSLFYFFKDGELIINKIMELSPLPARHENAVFDKFTEVSKAMFVGIFVTALIQGFVAGIGYVIVGIDNPLFWATATALFSLVPLIGTATIWVPAGIYLLIIGNYIGGIGLLLWGMLAVGSIDNFVRPYLIEGKSPVHPLMTFLAVLGGIFAFGLKGVIFGPLILNLLIAFLHIYEIEYANVLKE